MPAMTWAATYCASSDSFIATYRRILSPAPCSVHSFSTCWVDMRDTSMPSTDVPGKATWEYSTLAATQQPA